MNYYRVLGIDASATADEIKSAYRRKARETHPDANRDARSAAFKDVSEAYEVLSSPERREAWEQSYREAAQALGLHVCKRCFSKVRVRPFSSSEIPKCGDCRQVLDIDPEESRSQVREAMARQLGDLIETVGAETASFAKDAIKTGAAALRRKLGIARTR